MRAYNNRVVHTKSKELGAWRRKIAWSALGVGCRVFTGEVHICVDFALSRPKTVTRGVPTVPPDLDKLIRAVLDALTGVAYRDDSQVTLILASKVYGQEGVRIKVSGDT